MSALAHERLACPGGKDSAGHPDQVPSSMTRPLPWLKKDAYDSKRPLESQVLGVSRGPIGKCCPACPLLGGPNELVRRPPLVRGCPRTRFRQSALGLLSWSCGFAVRTAHPWPPDCALGLPRDHERDLRWDLAYWTDRRHQYQLRSVNTAVFWRLLHPIRAQPSFHDRRIASATPIQVAGDHHGHRTMSHMRWRRFGYPYPYHGIACDQPVK